MNPILLLAGLGGLGFWVWKKTKKPTVDDYQSVTVPTPSGIPVTVATPVAEEVTVAQAVAEPMAPSVPGPVQSVPITIADQGTFYAPPNSVQVAPNGGVTQMAPIIVSPGGSANIAVGTILDVQRALNTLGAVPKLQEDGKLGAKTTAAIKGFQSKNHLAVDGVAGPATKAALSAALLLLAGGGSVAGATAQFSNPASGIATTPTGASIDTTPALKWGTRDVQHALNLLGAKPPLTEDGSTGPKTVAAVKSYQAANGLTPDGIAGAKTKTALYLTISSH